jgi:N utilization substance protein B
MASRSLSRELALLVLGQVSEQKKSSIADLGIESLLDKALESLTQHWRETLDSSATELDQAQHVSSIANFNRVRLLPWMLSVITCVHR